jgi:glucokinase
MVIFVSPERDFALGLDIGGSSIKSAILDFAASQPKVLHKELVGIDNAREPKQIVDNLVSITASYRERCGTIKSIGVGVPGTIDNARGVSLVLPNFPPEWKGFPIRNHLESSLNQKVALVNDADAFAIAETTLGAGVGMTTAVCLVLGTGVGGSIVHRGSLFRGLGTAGEFGHITVDLDGPLCGCGNRGCVETLAGSDAIAAHGKSSSAKKVFEDAATGNAIAKEVIDRAAAALGAAVANIYIILAPDAFIIGGGIAETRSSFLQQVESEARHRVFVASDENIRVFKGQLGRHAGAIGAGLVARG